MTLEFRVFLVSAKTEQHTQESRTIRFWFRDWLSDGERKAQVAQDFFRELVSPKEFPRGFYIKNAFKSNAECSFHFHLDYVGFIKKIMKQMQKGYNEIQSVEIELRILEQTSAPPSRPREYLSQFDKSPETEMATVRIKKVRWLDEVLNSWSIRDSSFGDRDN